MTVSQCTSSIWDAILNLLFLWVMPYFLYIFARLPRAFLPKAGNAYFDPSQQNKTASFIKIHLDAEAVEPSTQLTKSIKCKVVMPYEAYYLTGITSLEAAMATCFNETSDVFGVTSISAGLGQSYVTRLDKANVTVSTISVL